MIKYICIFLLAANTAYAASCEQIANVAYSIEMAHQSFVKKADLIAEFKKNPAGYAFLPMIDSIYSTPAYANQNMKQAAMQNTYENVLSYCLNHES